MLGRLFGGNQGFLARSLRGTEWHQFLDYLAPSFLEVLPARQLVSQGRELLSNARDSEGFSRLRAETGERLRARGIAVRCAPSEAARGATPAGELDGAAARELGQRALEIYFGQIALSEAAILDLRAARFAVDPEGEALWTPRPFHVRWKPEFLEALRALYRGFYRDDEAAFAGALATLQLEPAADVFRTHFGDGDQRRVRFRTEVFHSTFHEAFVRCRDAGSQLHPNFLALGIYLACLYDLLESLGQEFDVRDAFERACP